MADSGTAVKYAPSGVTLIPRPGPFELLAAPGRVTVVSAPAGSGKTFLLRSWIAAEGLADRAAWVSVAREEHDPHAFWLSVLDSLRRSGPGAERVRELTAAPGQDGAALVRRLAEDLSSLKEPVWLVIDDLHDLQDGDAVRQLGELLAGTPRSLRLVLLTRRDLPLGLHRLRLEGELTEIRGEDLRFSLEESRALMDAAGVRLSDGALESLVTITEGWAAGLRLVALRLARHPDPERCAAGFSGRERVVAEYLLAEVLERHSRLRSTHASLISEILNLLSGHTPATRPGDAGPPIEPLSDSELRVLRYLPTNLRASEIAGELFVSRNTIRTHIRNVYLKLGVHSRADAVTRARDLGLLSPTSLKR